MPTAVEPLKINIIFTNHEIRGRKEMAERNSIDRMVARSLDDLPMDGNRCLHPTNTLL
jgi:hypothetical protein